MRAQDVHLRLMSELRDRVHTHYASYPEQRSHGVRLTPLQNARVHERVKELFEKGWSRLKIAAELDVSLRTVQGHLKRMGK